MKKLVSKLVVQALNGLTFKGHIVGQNRDRRAARFGFPIAERYVRLKSEQKNLRRYIFDFAEIPFIFFENLARSLLRFRVRKQPYSRNCNPKPIARVDIHYSAQIFADEKNRFFKV